MVVFTKGRILRLYQGRTEHKLCLFFFNIRILIVPLVSSNSSNHFEGIHCLLIDSLFVQWQMFNATSGAGTANPSGEPEFIPVLMGFELLSL
jgi:hypothetical protein